MAILHGEVKRRVSVAVRRVKLCAELEQKHRDAEIAVDGGPVKRRIVVCILDRRACAAVAQKDADKADGKMRATLAGRHEERGGTCVYASERARVSRECASARVRESVSTPTRDGSNTRTFGEIRPVNGELLRGARVAAGVAVHDAVHDRHHLEQSAERGGAREV